MLTFGLVVLGVTDSQRAGKFWSGALRYQVRDRPFGAWARSLTPPPGQAGPVIALQTSRTVPQDYPRLHFALHVHGTAEQEAEAARLASLGAGHVGWDSFPDDPDVIVLADPDGNRFCIVDLDHDSA